MKPLNNQKYSYLPFKISASKRGMFQGEIPYSQLSIDPIVQNLTPEWESLFNNLYHAGNKNSVWVRNPPQKGLHVLPISSELIPNVGLKVLPNGRVCMAEKMLAGILMPKNPSVQYVMLRKFLAWYLPCMELHRNKSFLVNKNCFAEWENTFLRIYYHIYILKSW